MYLSSAQATWNGRISLIRNFQVLRGYTVLLTPGEEFEYHRETLDLCGYIKMIIMNLNKKRFLWIGVIKLFGYDCPA